VPSLVEDDLVGFEVAGLDFKGLKLAAGIDDRIQ
jgi:hypothetical protein